MLMDNNINISAAANRRDTEDMREMKDTADVAVLIPAYKPEGQFVDLVRELAEIGVSVYVVDDGSGEAYADRFSEAERFGARLLRHDVNLGKGRAIKTGLEAIMRDGTPFRGVVTADADGQHCVEDILRVAAAVTQNGRGLVIGVRAFDKDVPAQNMLGNGMTRLVYALSTRIVCHDTQTGLRGFPRDIWQSLLEIAGEHYEYEMNMLLKVRELGCDLVEVPIKTIYIDANTGSHFKPLMDSLRIYGVILRYSSYKIVSFLVDYFIFSVLTKLRLFAALSYAIARVASLLPYIVTYAASSKVSRIGLRTTLLPAGVNVWITSLVICAAAVELFSLIFGFTEWWMKLAVDAVAFACVSMKAKSQD